MRRDNLTSVAPASRGGKSSVTGTLASLSLSMLLSSLGTSIANVALPTLSQAFGAPFHEIQWIVLAYLLVITSLIVSVGRLGDLVGHKRLLLFGLILYAVASIFCATTSTLWIMIAARGLQGLGAAIMMALSLALVGGTVPQGKVGSAMGLLGTMSAVGTALGPSLGGVMIGAVGWRSIFWITAIVAILAYFVTNRYLSADQQEKKVSRASIDVAGTLLLAITLLTYALAMTNGANKFDLLKIAFIVTSILGACLFVYAETKSTSPLIQLTLFRDPLLIAGLASSALVSTVLMATLVVGPFYLTYALGLNAALVGIVMSTGPIVVALTGVPAGQLVDRIGSQSLTVVGLLGIAAGSVILFLMPLSFGLKGFLSAIVILTAGYSLFQTANNTAVMAGVLQNKRGVISGMLSLSRNLGLITGASFMGAVFALASGTNDLSLANPTAVSFGMRLTFAVAAVLIIIAFVITIFCRALATRLMYRVDPAYNNAPTDCIVP